MGPARGLREPISRRDAVGDPRNGTGWSDVLLSSALFNVEVLANRTLVQFKTVINDATDGRENIFLISTATDPCPPVPGCDVVTPEPATLALLGSGIVALGLGRLRRRREEQ